MTHRKGAIWTERVLLALILGSLLGSLNLIIALNRRSASEPNRDARSTPTSQSPTVASMPVVRDSEPISASPNVGQLVEPATDREPVESIAPPAPPRVDPTKKILASLASARDRETQASEQADRRSEALEQARLAAVAASAKWKRRELLVRQQIASLNQRADEIETSVSILDAERDVLAHERDALKAALSKASLRSGFAVLPYKGPNGTWRRPIVIECTAGAVKLQPQGLSFSMLELSPYLHPRSSPFIRAIAHELLHIQSSDTPDGAPVVPYLVFLVRPDGIRPYYEARSRLEPLGIAFGYELIEQDLAVDIPDFDNLTTWDGSVPLEMPLERAPQPKSNVAMLSTARPGTSGMSTGSSNWSGDDHSSPGGSGWGSSKPRGSSDAGSANPDSSTPDDFVWPSRGRQTGGASLPGAGSPGTDLHGDTPTGKTSGYSGTTLGIGQPESAGGRDSGSPSGPASSLGEPGKLANLNQPPNAGRALAPTGDGSGWSADTPGVGALQSQGQRQQPGGSGLGLSGAGGLSALPDLEPAGDAVSSPPVQPGGGSSLGLSPGAGGVGPFNVGGGLAPGSTASTGGSGSSNLNTSAAGQSDNLGGSQPLGSAASIGGAGSSNVNASAGGQSGNLGGDQAVGGAITIGESGSSNLNASAGGQSDNLGGGQAVGGAPSTGGSGPSSSNASAGGQDPGLAPYPGAMGGVAATGSGSTPNQSGGLGQYQASGLGQGSGGGLPPSASPSGNVSIPSDLPQLPPDQNVGTPPSNQPPAAGANTASGPLTSSDVLSLPPQGSNVSGTASGSKLGMPSQSSLASAAGSSSSIDSAASASSSSSTSSTQSSSMTASGGTPPGSMSASGTPSASGSTLSFGPDFGSASDSSKEKTVPPPPKPVLTMGSIEVPFEIVVVCRQRDLLLHPGGYRLTTQAMKEQGGGKDGLLAREIRAVVTRRAQVDPMIRPRPKLTFLVEANGSETFWTARRQLLFSLPEWPMSLQVAETQGVHVFNKETW